MVDADLDPRARWTSLTGALTEAGYRNLPNQPDEGGTIIPSSGALPTVGIWLMPNNRLEGILEDFLRFLIRDDDVLLPKAESCIDSVAPEYRRFRASYRSKALIHTWLAWQEEPGTTLGLALTKRYLNAEHSIAVEFMQWLARLFLPE
ncbi:MAG: DUF3226 domain-containing protein [Pseudomonadota bacterium]